MNESLQRGSQLQARWHDGEVMVMRRCLTESSTRTERAAQGTAPQQVFFSLPPISLHKGLSLSNEGFFFPSLSSFFFLQEDTQVCQCKLLHLEG